MQLSFWYFWTQWGFWFLANKSWSMSMVTQTFFTSTSIFFLDSLVSEILFNHFQKTFDVACLLYLTHMRCVIKLMWLGETILTYSWDESCEMEIGCVGRKCVNFLIKNCPRNEARTSSCDTLIHRYQRSKSRLNHRNNIFLILIGCIVYSTHFQLNWKSMF